VSHSAIRYKNDIENVFCEYSHASCGCGILSVTLRKEHRLRVFQNRELIKIFGPRGRGGEDYIMGNLMICTCHQILFR